MKKLVLLFAAATMAVSASAQTVAESMNADNWYVGINGGVMTKTTGHAWLDDLNPNAGVRIGRWFTPVFGLAADGTAYFGSKPFGESKTAVTYSNVSLLGTVNLSNWFGGYPGEPRNFEVIALYGLGWGHAYAPGKPSDHPNYGFDQNDQVTSKIGLDFAFNFGKDKAWQFYVEPSINYAVAGTLALSGDDQTEYNINRSAVQLNAGLIYKFKNSNGTHNFVTVIPRDQAEIDGLNAQINDLRAQLNAKERELSAKNRQIAELQAALDECNKRPVEAPKTTATNLQPTVFFQCGKSVIEKSQYAPIEMIAKYMKNHPEANILIKGYASPEGPADLNQRLSENRAAAVKEALVKKYGISANRLSTEGCGPTDKLFDELEFNRVATFNDQTK